jgi:hypothetical protein
VPGLALDDATARRSERQCLTRDYRVLWRVVDHLDYVLTLTKLRILDALAGSELETPADEQRKRDQERIERAFPRLNDRESDAAVPKSRSPGSRFKAVHLRQ